MPGSSPTFAPAVAGHAVVLPDLKVFQQFKGFYNLHYLGNAS
jgi:hypothetical protein